MKQHSPKDFLFSFSFSALYYLGHQYTKTPKSTKFFFNHHRGHREYTERQQIHPKVFRSHSVSHSALGRCFHRPFHALILILRSVFRRAGGVVAGRSGCLAGLRRGGGTAESPRSHSLAWQPQGHYKHSTPKSRQKIK